MAKRKKESTNSVPLVCPGVALGQRYAKLAAGQLQTCCSSMMSSDLQRMRWDDGTPLVMALLDYAVPSPHPELGS